jgi:Mo-co oxidoreductase dimerisation domain
LTVRGYAAATGRTIERVDISLDNGGRWYQAKTEPRTDAPWSWTFWELTLDLPVGNHEVAVRASDSAGADATRLGRGRMELQRLPLRRLAPSARERRGLTPSEQEPLHLAAGVFGNASMNSVSRG